MKILCVIMGLAAVQANFQMPRFYGTDLEAAGDNAAAGDASTEPPAPAPPGPATDSQCAGGIMPNVAKMQAMMNDSLATQLASL